MLKEEWTTGWLEVLVRGHSKWKSHKTTGHSVVPHDTDPVVKSAKNSSPILSPDYVARFISGVSLWLSGSGQVSVLTQAHSSSPRCHKLEFTVKSTEELDTVMEELKTHNNGAGLQHSTCRLFLHKPTHSRNQGWINDYKADLRLGLQIGCCFAIFKAFSKGLSDKQCKCKKVKTASVERLYAQTRQRFCSGVKNTFFALVTVLTVGSRSV